MSAATPQQLDAANARLREAQATLESLTSTRASVQGRVGALLAAVASARAANQAAIDAVHLAEVQLSEAQVLSPFDGLVVSRNLEVGEWAAPGTAVVTVEDLSRLWVRLDVEETAIGRVRVGEGARVRVVALPDRQLRGRVIEVGAEGDFAVNRDVKRGRPDIRTFRVRVLVEDPPAELRPGMTAEVEFTGTRVESAPAGGASAREAARGPPP